MRLLMPLLLASLLQAAQIPGFVIPPVSEDAHQQYEQALLKLALNLAGLSNFTCRSIANAADATKVEETGLQIHRGERLLTLTLRLDGCRLLRHNQGNGSGEDEDGDENDAAGAFTFKVNGNSEGPASAPITFKQTIVFTVCGAIISAFFLVAAILRFRSRLKKKLYSNRRERSDAQCDGCSASGGGGNTVNYSRKSREHRQGHRGRLSSGMKPVASEQLQRGLVERPRTMDQMMESDQPFSRKFASDYPTQTAAIDDLGRAINVALVSGRYEDDVISIQPASPLAALASSGCSSADPASPKHSEHQQQQPQQQQQQQQSPAGASLQKRIVVKNHQLNRPASQRHCVVQPSCERQRQSRCRSQTMSSAGPVRARLLHDLPSVSKPQL